MASPFIGSHAGTPLILGGLVLMGCLAGSGTVTGWSTFPPAEMQGHTATVPTVDGCRYCGVVEQVREIKSGTPRYGVSTVSGGRDEMIVLLLSALSGAPAASGQQKIYEVSVRMDNGSIRAIRGSRLPDWKLGDRVKVVKGQVEPLS
jgi:hypothetical protein